MRPTDPDLDPGTDPLPDYERPLPPVRPPYEPRPMPPLEPSTPPPKTIGLYLLIAVGVVFAVALILEAFKVG